MQAEDDVETMCCVIDCYSDLLLHGGYSKGSAGSTRVALQVGKHSVDNPLLGRKSWTRRVHIQRLTMHYQQRAERRIHYSLTKKHVTAIEDLVTLSLSHYSQVRSYAQELLNNCLDTFIHSYKLIMPRIMAVLSKPKDEASHEEFKGALHLLLGPKNDGKNLLKKNWQVIKELWPAVVLSKHTEKPR